MAFVGGYISIILSAGIKIKIGPKIIKIGPYIKGVIIPPAVG